MKRPSRSLPFSTLRPPPGKINCFYYTLPDVQLALVPFSNRVRLVGIPVAPVVRLLQSLTMRSDWSAEIQWAVLIIQGLTMQLRRADSLYLQRLRIRGYAKRQQNGRQSWSNSE